MLSLLGLAQKAGKVASGEFATESAIKSGKAALAIVAEDASENTRKKMKNMTDYYNVPMLLYGTKEELGTCIGKEYRSMVAVLDKGFSESLKKKHAQVSAVSGKGQNHACRHP